MIRTARLLLRPVAGQDLALLIRLKADPLAFGQMLGGVRTPLQAIDELAADIGFWATRRIGMFAVHEGPVFQGTVGIHDRPDGLGLSLRFAVWPQARGRGLAREASVAVLRYAHDAVGIDRIVAVAREDNFASRMILGAIGMRECDAFLRSGMIMVVYESRRQ